MSDEKKTEAEKLGKKYPERAVINQKKDMETVCAAVYAGPPMPESLPPLSQEMLQQMPNAMMMVYASPEALVIRKQIELAMKGQLPDESEKKFCTNCGALNGIDAKFCEECGRKFPVNEQPEQK